MLHIYDKVYLILFDESDERGPFDFNWLLRPVVQCDHEMKEIGFSQIARWLLLEMCPSHADTVHRNKTKYT